jgi:monoamine oxidase
MTHIAIVGAGLAGLNAALTLQDAGLTCSVYEASQRIGGRMHSDTTTWTEGMVSEWCGEFIDSDHDTLHHLIKRFGLRTTALSDERTKGTSSVLYFLNHYYGADQLDEDFETLAPLLHQQLQDAGFPTTHDSFTQEGFRLDHLSVYEWIERYVQGGHHVPVGRILNNACTGLYGLDTNEQSALNLVYLFGSRDPAKGSITSGPLQGSSKIVGGNQQLPLALAHSLSQGSIKLDHQLMAIERKCDASLTLTFTTANSLLKCRVIM